MQHIVHVLTAGTMLVAAGFSGCGGNNAELSRIHRQGADCSHDGCHKSAGAGGTVYSDLEGTASLPGVTVEAWADGQTVILGRTDSQGNFLYLPALQGSFVMAAGGITSETTLHPLPDWRGCNYCHTYPPQEPGVPGRIYGR